MEQILSTPRLKLTLLTAAEHGSPEFDWIHELRSNEQSMSWSIFGASKTVDDTKKKLAAMLPTVGKDGEEKVYRINYAVHEIIQGSNAAASMDPQTRFIGVVSLRSVSPEDTKSLPRLGFESTADTLSLEIAYSFLPTAWGRGYATEAITAMFDACRKADKSLWAPRKNVYVRAIVNNENQPSQRVLEKCGMGAHEVLKFAGERFYLNGKWVEEHCLYMYGKMIVEG